MSEYAPGLCIISPHNYQILAIQLLLLVYSILVGVPEDEIFVYIHVALFVLYTILACAGILFALICLVINIYFRDKKCVLHMILNYNSTKPSHLASVNLNFFPFNN